MNTKYYDRYKNFKNNGMVRPDMPFIPISTVGTDLFITYDSEKMRLDTLSYKYYGDANYGWLILQANPSYSGYEFAIPSGVRLRIPYPIDSALSRYEQGVDRWINENSADY